MTARFDITPFLHLPEGQHFERKSLFDGEPGRKKPRDRRDVRDQIAEYVAGFANAEGGVLIFGIEDDGTITGHKYVASVVDEMLRVPSSRIEPPLANGFRLSHQGVELLVFEVTIADAPVMVTGNGYPLRMGDTTLMVAESKIRALKLEGLAESWVNRPSAMTLTDLDTHLLAQAKKGAGYPDLEDDTFLINRKLADRKTTGLVLRRAAELLFAREPDHPNAGVRIFRVLGSERRVGVDYNVEELPRLEGPLPKVLSDTFATVLSLLRKPARLRGSRFTPTPEYPEFAWKEAILNAVAHRDYGNQGRSIEVTLFDDRMEVTSPGALLPEVTIDALRTRTRVHQSRNPRLVRPLVDLGFMRDQGEGLPRLFAEMESLFLPEPELESLNYGFSLTLRNTPTLTESDRTFIAALDAENLSSLEFRALLEAFRQGRVSNASMRSLAGLDILQASRLLVSLRDRGLLQAQSAGPATFYTLADRLALGAGRHKQAPVNSLDELPSIGPAAGDIGKSSRQFEAELPSIGPAPVSSRPAANQRPRGHLARVAILEACKNEWRAPAELAKLLRTRSVDNLTRRHLTPMVEAGLLERRFAEKTHPHQAYRATAKALATLSDTNGDQ